MMTQLTRHHQVPDGGCHCGRRDEAMASVTIPDHCCQECAFGASASASLTPVSKSDAACAGAGADPVRTHDHTEHLLYGASGPPLRPPSTPFPVRTSNPAFSGISMAVLQPCHGSLCTYRGEGGHPNPKA